MAYEDQILALAKKGPVQPVQVAKALNTNSLMASAFLSDLSSKGKLKVSNLKIGSSPLYYDPENPSQLQNFVYALGEKEKRAYDIIFQKKVVPSDSLDPLMQVCMKSLKDFAQPVEVVFQGKVALFWKWYMLRDEEVEAYVRPYFQQEPVVELPDKKNEHNQEKILADELTKTNAKTLQNQPKQTPQEYQVSEPSHTNLKPQKKIKKRKLIKDNLLSRAEVFFSKKYIRVTEHVSSRKNKEHEFIVQRLDGLKEESYYCKVVKKKNITDIDISLAYAYGQMKKLPVIFLHQGELNKSAKQLIEGLSFMQGEKI